MTTKSGQPKLVGELLKLQVEELPGKLANRETVRSYATQFKSTYKIPFDNIRIRDNFNVRITDMAIEELAAGIFASNFVTPPIEGDMDSDGFFYIVEGHRRYFAMKFLKEQGHPVKEMEAFVNNNKTKEDERIFKMFTSQNNKKLEPLELALVFSRLEGLGYKKQEIANRIGKGLDFVKDHLELAKEDIEIQHALEEGLITLTSITKARKKHVAKSELKDIIKTQKAKGKTVKNKDISVAVAKKKQQEFGVSYEMAERVILDWASYSQHDKKELTQLKKDMKALWK